MSQTPSHGGPSMPPASTPTPSAQTGPVVYVNSPARERRFAGGFFSGIGRIITAAIIFFIFAMVVVGTITTISEMGSMPEVYRDGSQDRRVAIIELAGLIDGSASEFVRHAVDSVLADDTMEAVVFRVDSGGGGVTASDQIWYQINRLKQDGRPVIASYGGTAASGGVYVSCHSDYIFAEPTTLTGSIGVIAQIMTAGGLMEKIGIEPVTMVAEGSPDKDTANDLFRSWTDKDRAKIQPILNHSYDVFFNRVLEGRKHVIGEESSLRALADGSVFMADDALAHGLVDAIGYLDDAVDHAISAASLPSDAGVVILRPWEGGLNIPFVRERTSTASDRLRNVLDGTPETVRLWWHEMSRPRAMYLMP